MAKEYWNIKESELDDYHVRIVRRNISSSFIIEGSVGSDKSVLALYRCRWYFYITSIRLLMGKVLTNKIAATLLLLFFLNSSAQSTKPQLPRKEFRVNLETVMYQKLIETSSNGGSSFNSRDAPSGILSISNYYRLKHNFAIEPSIGITVIPYNYNYDVKLEPNHPMYKNRSVLSHNSYEFALPSSKVGLFISKEFYLKNMLNIFTGLGINLNTYPTYLFESGVSYNIDDNQPDSSFRLFQLTLSDEGHTRAYWSNLTYSGKVGFSKRNSKGNGYSISLVFNLQPNTIGTGNYYFDQGSYIESGTIKWKNSYYGFCFSKSFNRDK
jgi:hypothetical protein